LGSEVTYGGTQYKKTGFQKEARFAGGIGA
jgi:hypothetical protein